MHAAALALMLANLGPGSVVAVIGMPGTGKTRAVQAAESRGELGRRIVFDPYGARDRTLARQGDKVTPWPGQLVTLRQLATNVHLLRAGNLRLVVAPSSLDPEKMGAEFADLAELAWAQGRLTVVAEEAALYGRACVPAILRVASGGRHAGLRLVLVCQSIGRLPIDARRHLTAVVAHAQGEPQDLDDIRRRCGADFTTRVQALRVGDAPAIWRIGDSQ